MCFCRKHFKPLIYVFCVLFLSFIFLPLNSTNTLATEKKKAVIVVLDKITLSNLKEGSYPTIKSLINSGALGIMNTNTAGDTVPESAYLTIGSGNRVYAPFGYLAYNSEEFYVDATAGEVYKRLIGSNPPTNGIVHLGLPAIINANKSLNYETKPGYLGQSLHNIGLKTAVLGNSDTDKDEKRQIVTIAMDQKGVVDYGDVSGDLLTKDSNALLGKRTDYDILLNEFTSIKDKADLIAIDLGDTSRVESANNIAFKEVLNKGKKDALDRADAFLARIIKAIDIKKDLLIVVTPTPSAEADEQENSLTPIIINGPGFTKGVATSGTTKRPGIVTNTDVTSTVIKYFGAKQDAFITGQPIVSEYKNNSMNTLLSLNEQIVFTHNNRPPLLITYRNFIIIIILAAFLAVLFRYNIFILKPLLIAVLAMPLAILLLPILPSVSIPFSILELILTTIVITIVSLKVGPKSIFDPIIIIGLLTGFLLDIDIILGSPLIRTSALGFDPMSGARYYGIGNEYMGVLLGALIISSTALIYRLPQINRMLKALMGILFIVTTYIMAAPNLGSKAGGILAAIAGFVVTLLLWYDIKFNKKNMLLAFTVIIAGILIFVGLDTIRHSANQSHFGRTISLIKEGGFKEITNIIIRKESVNITLITRTQWSWLYIINLLPLIVFHLRRRYQHIKIKYPLIIKGIIGLISCSIVALIFNDSGIVAASTMISFASVPMLLIALEEKL